jgi:FlaA1/EpsC-like NDP-sugar epimerase
VVNGMIMFKRELGEAALDFMLVCVAYLGAFVLHYGLPNPAAPGPDPYLTLPQLLSSSLAFVVVVKMSMLLVFQAYRGMWRYVGVSDLMNLAKATLLASVLLVIALPFLVRDLIIPRSILLIDFLLFTFLVIGSRVSFAALNDTFARMQSTRLPHVLIVGAGDLGELVLRSLIRSRPASYRAIGFLDPDPHNRNRTLHTVRVLGTPEDLANVAATYDVDVVVLALPMMYAALAEELRQRCESIGVPAYAAATFVEMHFSGALALGPGASAPVIDEDAAPDRNN